MAQLVKNSTLNAGDLGSFPGLRRSPGEGTGYPLQYSGLENSTDCIVPGVSKSRTQLSNFHFRLEAQSREWGTPLCQTRYILISSELWYIIWKMSLSYIVAGEKSRWSYWLWVMPYCWSSMFPGPLKRSVHSACWEEEMAVTCHPRKDLTACKKAWLAWEECYAYYLPGMENKNYYYILNGPTLHPVDLSLSRGIRHTFMKLN